MMCGLAAIYSYACDGPSVEREELLRMRDYMARRGPDGAGLWVSSDGRAGLAHRRLAIIDPDERAAQPMGSADGAVWIVYNGEIYNYKMLRAQLESKGHKFITNSDTEVVLAAYLEYGRHFVERLRGMYAFAIWDGRSRGMLLGRDPLGIKPLYYADDGRVVRVASQVKALMAGGGVSTEPNPAGHVGFYLWGAVPDPFTLYRRIQAAPAGSTIWVGNRGAGAPHQHQSLRVLVRDAEAQEPRDVMHREDMLKELKEILRDSVRAHLVSDVPVAVFLSAGIDSTVVASFAVTERGDTLDAITASFDEYTGTPLDESRLAATVAEVLGLQHRTGRIAKSDFEQDLDAILSAMDQPTINGVNTYFVSKCAAQAGMKVVLSGLGGDELFAGYPGFRQIPRLVRAIAPFGVLAEGVGRAARKALRKLWAALGRPKHGAVLEYGGSFPGAYLLKRGLFMPWELDSFLDADFVREGLEELQPLARLAETVAGVRSDRLKVTLLEMEWYMRNQLLRDSDWAGMAHSVEIRVPLVDLELFRRLLPFLTSEAPPGKGELALTSPVPLPDEVLDRPKTGFSIPVYQWASERCGVQVAAPDARTWARQVMGLWQEAA